MALFDLEELRFGFIWLDRPECFDRDVGPIGATEGEETTEQENRPQDHESLPSGSLARARSARFSCIDR